MKHAKFQRILAFALTVVMILPLLPVVTFAEDDPNVYFAQDFSTATDFATANLKNGSGEWGKFATEPAIADGKMVVPLTELNHDKRIYLTHSQLKAADVEVVVWEADFEFSADANDNQGFRLRVQQLKFDETTYANGVKDTKADWPNIAFVKSSGMWYPDYSGEYIPGNVKVTPGEAFNFKMIFNMKEGTICTYVNGILDNVATGIFAQVNNSEVFYYADVQNMIFQANKVMFNPVYFAGASPTATCKIDNIKLYRDDTTIPVEYNGTKMNVVENSDFLLKQTNSTFQYAEVTKGEDTRYTAKDTVKIDGLGYKINATYADGVKYLAQDFGIFQYVNEIGADYGFGGDLPPVGTYSIEDGVDASALAFKYLKIPFKAGSETNGTGEGSLVDKNMTYNNAEMSYAKTPVVEISADYFFSAGAKGTVQAQAKSYQSGSSAKTWLDLFQVQFNGGATGQLIASGTKVADAVEPKAGEWFNVMMNINLVKGTATLYLNGVAYMTGIKLAATNLTIPADQLMMSKVNKLGTAYGGVTVDAFAADSYFGIKNIVAEDGPKAGLKIDGVDVSLPIGADYSFNQKGKIFQQAVITYAVPAGAPAGTAPKVETIVAAQATSVLVTAEMEDASIVTTYTTGLFELDFEDAVYEDGKPVAVGGQLAAVHPNHAIKSEGEGDAANKYMHIPFQGKANPSTNEEKNSSNWDKSLKTKNPEILADGRYVIEIDYRPHAGFAADGNPTIEAQFEKLSCKDAEGNEKTNGQYFSLFTINVKTGELKIGAHAMDPVKVENAPTLTMDQWNTVKVIIDAEKGAMELYLNDELHTSAAAVKVQYYSGGWQNYENATHLVLPADRLIVAKCNKQAAFYTEDPTQDMYYIDVDNITLRYLKDVVFTLDGAETKLPEGSMVNLDRNNSDKLLAAAITVDGKTEYITDMKFMPKNGMDIKTYWITSKSFTTEAKAEFRMGTPSGIRFLSSIKQEELLALRYVDLYDAEKNPGTTLKEVKYGTIIAPADFLVEGEDFTKAVLDAKGTDGYVEVLGIPREEYNFDGLKDKYIGIAGSLTNIKEENLDRDFIGRGFIELVMTDGTSIIQYADWTNNAANISKLAEDTLAANTNLSDVKKAFVESFIVAG